MPRWVDSVLAAVSPPVCLLCRLPAVGMDICAGCLDDLPWLGAGCRHCGMPLNEPVCAGCSAADARIQNIDYCAAAMAYEFPVDRLITRLKYQGRPAAGRLLGELLAIRVLEARNEAIIALPDALVPVPLHPRRLWSRGFNQAAEISCWAAHSVGLPVRTDLLSRSRATPSQTGLSRATRLQNPSGSFRASRSVRGLRVAVVDDVATTMATLTEAARILKLAGAREVQVWVCARSLG